MSTCMQNKNHIHPHVFQRKSRGEGASDARRRRTSPPATACDLTTDRSQESGSRMIPRSIQPGTPAGRGLARRQTIPYDPTEAPVVEWSGAAVPYGHPTHPDDSAPLKKGGMILDILEKLPVVHVETTGRPGAGSRDFVHVGHHVPTPSPRAVPVPAFKTMPIPASKRILGHVVRNINSQGLKII